MKCSKLFKRKMLINNIAYLSIFLTCIFILVYIFINDNSYQDHLIIYILIGIILISILLIISLKWLNRFSKQEKKIIYDELDNHLEKAFYNYGLFITTNYIICIGEQVDITRLYVIPIKDISAIDINYNNQDKYKHKFLNIFLFINSSSKKRILDDYVLTIICGKKFYNIKTISRKDSKRKEELNEIIEYLKQKYSNIDFV